MSYFPNNPQDDVLLGTPNADGTWTGVTAGATVSATIQPGSWDSIAFIIIGNGTIASGVVTIEEAYKTATQAAYAGTWSTITTVTASTLTGNAQQVIHISPNTFLPIRVRISTAIGGGGGISVVLRRQ